MLVARVVRDLDLAVRQRLDRVVDEREQAVAEAASYLDECRRVEREAQRLRTHVNGLEHTIASLRLGSSEVRHAMLVLGGGCLHLLNGLESIRSMNAVDRIGYDAIGR